MTHPIPIRRVPGRPTLLDAALNAAARGWHVHPLRPGSKASALHGEHACPQTGECAGGHVKWEQRATTDPDRIRVAWGAGAFNVGIATGPSGLVVVDLDVPKEKNGKGSSDAPCGATSFSALCERAGVPWPTTHTVRTPSGGWHLYFQAPPGVRLPCTAKTVAPNVDTRAWGGNIVAAGSVTTDGAYEVTDHAPVAVLPAWLLRRLQPAPRPAAAPAPLLIPGGATRRATVALERETARVSNAPEGQRHHLLLTRTIVIGRFVVWGEIARDVVEQAFGAAGEAAGLPAAECRATIRDALAYSARTCRARETA
ncbi:bifunctional DNA primase/polymerase [Streptomyces sp. Li-HN-5-11]|uniref:bifunctional DNA primase/polymerase n=1 Tax=Streptomyces sp. Li-HN-5-11 TaxID=3075432 RepID=UPI0028A588C6|nr:bifunctional DNA primase/polymerase [Streptomyces sp. Li-HN-5-11]WNM29530.1 bifunctional DNA primase/polymerase [Streptomyces sp. Li-HN-5-11]